MSNYTIMIILIKNKAFSLLLEHSKKFHLPMKFMIGVIAFLCIILDCSAFVINADEPIADEPMVHECGHANMSEVSIIDILESWICVCYGKFHCVFSLCSHYQQK